LLADGRGRLSLIPATQNLFLTSTHPNNMENILGSELSLCDEEGITLMKVYTFCGLGVDHVEIVPRALILASFGSRKLAVRDLSVAPRENRLTFGIEFALVLAKILNQHQLTIITPRSCPTCLPAPIPTRQPHRNQKQHACLKANAEIPSVLLETKSQSPHHARVKLYDRRHLFQKRRLGKSTRRSATLRRGRWKRQERWR